MFSIQRFHASYKNILRSSSWQFKIQILKQTKLFTLFCFEDRNDKDHITRQLYEQELQLYQSIKACMQSMDYESTIPVLTIQIKLLTACKQISLTKVISKGQNREKISLNHQRSLLLQDAYNILEKAQLKAGKEQFELQIKQLEILQLLEGQFGNLYIDKICKVYHHKQIRKEIEFIYDEMLEAQINNTKFKKIAICNYLMNSDFSIYEKILEISEEIDDINLEKQFHLKSIQISLSEGYFHSLKYHIEKCLPFQWNQDQLYSLLLACSNLPDRINGKHDLKKQLSLIVARE